MIMAIVENAFDEKTEKVEQFDQTISKWTKALEIDPEDADAYYNRGLTYNVMGEWDQAISDFTKSLEIRPGNADALFNRGIAYEEKGQWWQAISDYNETLEAEPEDAAAWYRKGGALRNAGKDYDAMKAYESFIKFALPESVEDVKEIGRVIKDLRNRVRGKYEEVAHC
jgi:tetratricopeptide (TPR) repeat protein